ncbi:hypothetical protein ACFL2Z_03845 [Candidatus Eisenbacteria bacterium]|uniref:Inhibitor I9 domain-containing protein n=1 Tax=Eiseniibacteriota bacterium TaxID=2212470 RepID=A0ABV6YPM6_UNCEI
MIWAARVIVMIVLVGILGCGSEAPPPQVTDEEMSLAIEEIESDPVVIDAAVQQEGKKLSLAVIVTPGTSKTEAMEVGERFVRLVKTFSKDTPPQKEVGKGIYDYLVGVYYPGNVELALGAKVSFARSISW